MNSVPVHEETETGDRKKVAVEGLEQALRNLGKVPFSEMGDAESDAIRDARKQLSMCSSNGKSEKVDS